MIDPPKTPVNVVIKCHQSPGDCTIMHRAIMSICHAYPHKFNFIADTYFNEIFFNSPYIPRFMGTVYNIKLEQITDAIFIEGGQDWSQVDRRGDHLIQEWIRGIINELNKFGYNLVEPRMSGYFDSIFMTQQEITKDISNIHPDLNNNLEYWIIDAGWKTDYTCKAYPCESYQAIVDGLKGKVQFVAIGSTPGGDSGPNRHCKLDNVIDCVNRTDNRRDFMRLVYHSSGVLTPISWPLHLSAAIPTKTGKMRPCVCIAGGRESKAMIAYPNATILSMVGKIDCALKGACLKTCVEDRGDFGMKGVSQERCLRPENGIAACMRMITPKQVIAAIEDLLPRPIEEKRICIVSMSNQKEVRDITFDCKEKYAKMHNYGLRLEEKIFQEKTEKGELIPLRHPAWSKIPLILHLLSEYTHICWMDGDTIITNPYVKIESLIDDQNELWITNDENGINTGVMIWKSTNEVWHFLREAWAQTQFLNSGVYEQDAINFLLKRDPNRLRVKLLPQKMMNSYPNNHSKDDFILHVPRNDSYGYEIEKRLDILKRGLNGEDIHIPLNITTTKAIEQSTERIDPSILMRPGIQSQHLQNLIDELPTDKDLIGIEIGSYLGESAELFLDSGKFKKIYCIDPWLDNYDKSDIAANRGNMNEVEKQFDKRMSKYNGQCKKLKCNSDIAAGFFDDKSIDFVYVDGCHLYDYVHKDLTNYLPKIKDGGFICGHDFQWQDKDGKKLADAINKVIGKPDKLFGDGNWLKEIKH